MIIGIMKNKIVILVLLFTSLLLTSCSEESNSVNQPEETIPNAAYIYLDSTRQVIRGFGGVNMPGWTDVGDLTPDQVNTAFGTGTGQIGFSILRIRVPYDEATFNLEVPTALLAKSLGASIIASPWTPPASLKSNNNIVDGFLNENSYAAYAAHLKSFADYMSANGAPLYAISIQNEPDVTVNYESCHWSSTQMLKFVKENASAIGTKIIVPESFNFNHTISDVILNNNDAAAKVSIIGGHIYGGGVKSYPLAAAKGKEVWMTEHLVLDNDYDAALGTAKEIDDCMYAGMNAYVWWYIRRYYGPIDESGNVTKRGYAMSQYARFIRPGFVRVSATSSPQDDIFMTAYKNGSKIVIVAINTGSTQCEQKFILRNGNAIKFIPFTTSREKNCVQESDITVTDNTFSFILDKQSITTFVSE